MKDYIIEITYSWGEEEEPIVFSAFDDFSAFMKMVEIAIHEINETLSNYDDKPVSLSIDPENNFITLWYGYDNTNCYYNLKEAR